MIKFLAKNSLKSKSQLKLKFSPVLKLLISAFFIGQIYKGFSHHTFLIY